MPTGVPLSNETTARAMALLAVNSNQVEVADKLNIHQTTVSKLARREKIAIQALTLAFITKSRKLVLDNHILKLSMANKALRKGPKAVRENKDIIALADKAEYRALQVMGIVPSHTPSVVINQLFAGSQAQADSEELGIVRALLASKRDEDIQDGEIVPDEASGADTSTSNPGI